MLGAVSLKFNAGFPSLPTPPGCKLGNKRGMIQIEGNKKARISSVYNIFAFAFLFPSIWIIPRLLPSLHPGAEGSDGNPGLNFRELAPNMRLVFYPAIIGWTLLGVWIATLKARLQLLKEKTLLNS